MALVCGLGASVFGHRFVDMPESGTYLQCDGQGDDQRLEKGGAGNERDDERAGFGGGGYVRGERDRGATVEEFDAGGRGGTGLERSLRP